MSRSLDSGLSRCLLVWTLEWSVRGDSCWERERAFYQRLLDLGSQEDLEPLLLRALELITEVTGAAQGYIELYEEGPCVSMMAETDLVEKITTRASEMIPMEETPDTQRPQRPETEVRPGAGRRQFTRAYKQRVLALYDACEGQGEKAALLRREGLYSGYITNWRRQMAKTEKTKGRGRPKLTPDQRALRKCRDENERLKKRLERAELAL